MQYEERYYFEHRFMPQTLYSEQSKQLIMRLLQGRGDFIVNLYNLIGEESGYVCPYREDQFVFKPQLVGAGGGYPEFAMLVIDMPEPEVVPLCSRVVICHDDQFERIRYYTVEKTRGENNYMLCGADEDGRHLNYGSISEREGDQVLKVFSLYKDYLKETL